MTEVADGDAGGKIKKFISFVIPQACALTPDEQLLGSIGRHDVILKAFNGFVVQGTHGLTSLNLLITVK